MKRLTVLVAILILALCFVSATQAQGPRRGFKTLPIIVFLENADGSHPLDIPEGVVIEVSFSDVDGNIIAIKEPKRNGMCSIRNIPDRYYFVIVIGTNVGSGSETFRIEINDILLDKPKVIRVPLPSING